mgnify:CR=1 FL=1
MVFYVLLGTIFGFVLSRSGAADYDYIQGMFLFQRFQLYGIIGAAVVFLFSGLAINAVSRAAGAVIFEVRRQFREHPGIMQGTERPDYARVVDITADRLNRMFATNVNGSFLCAREAIKRMSTAHGGRGGAILPFICRIRGIHRAVTCRARSIEEV